VARNDRIGAALLTALIGVNLLAWPLGLDAGALAAPLLFAFAAAWIAGRRLGRGDNALLTLALLAAVAALACGQYVAGMAALDSAPGGIGTMKAFSEVALLVTAALVGLTAASRRSPRALVAGLGVSLLLVAAYAREPATLAIVSMWATGFTLSLPPVLYLAGFGAMTFAAVSWAERPDTRHLAAGLALLLVAGLQPQALHHGITAILGLMLLATPTSGSTSGPQIEEVSNAA
jgi:hypothetical protein